MLKEQFRGKYYFPDYAENKKLGGPDRVAQKGWQFSSGSKNYFRTCATSG